MRTQSTGSPRAPRTAVQATQAKPRPPRAGRTAQRAPTRDDAFETRVSTTVSPHRATRGSRSALLSGFPARPTEESVFTEWLPRREREIAGALFAALDPHALLATLPQAANVPKNVKKIFSELGAETKPSRVGDIFVATSDAGNRLLAVRAPDGVDSRYGASTLEYEKQTIFERLAAEAPGLAGRRHSQGPGERFGRRGVDAKFAHDVAAALSATAGGAHDETVAASTALLTATRDAAFGRYVHDRGIVASLTAMADAVGTDGKFTDGSVHVSIGTALVVAETDRSGRERDVTTVSGRGPLLLIHDDAGGRYNAVELDALRAGELRLHFYYDPNTHGFLHVDDKGVTRTHEGMVALYSLGWNLETTRAAVGARTSDAASSSR